ncbi:MAG TPA: DUF3313 domain-containing protein [Thermodesulfobacteriota bacterium]|nr:DUF3313 domain-containing protein [Thermodesulfobacteriota bacterium]
MKKFFALLFAVIALGACAGSPQPKTSKFLGEYYGNLKPVGAEGNTRAWIREGADFTKYKRVMVDYVVFSFHEDSESKTIDANELKKIADAASLALVNAFKENFPVVGEPGPDVLRVRTAITDLKQSRPALSGMSSVLPIGAGISLLKHGTTDSWTGSGATTAEVMFLDSTTSEVLAAGEDRRTAGYDDRFSKWGSAEDAFQYWGERISDRLLYLTKKK